jgi:hypothetical protein
MEIETLDADFYRERARLCHELADAATAARSLFVRLYVLAGAYEERAKAAEVAGGDSKSPDQRTLPQSME